MRPDPRPPCPGQGLSTVHPADVKEKRTAQRAFQKTQWAALDASMASNSKRRAREAEQEASRQASLAAQAAKARAKEIKRRESSGLYKLAPEFRAQQEVEVGPTANELGGRSVKSPDDSVPNVSTAEDPAASLSPRKPEPFVVVVASGEDPQIAAEAAASLEAEVEESVQVRDDAMMAPGTPSPREALPPVWPPPKREAPTQQSAGVPVSRISMGLEMVGGYATTTFTAPPVVNSFAGRSLQQHAAAAAGSSLAASHAAAAAATAAAVAREAWEQTAAEVRVRLSACVDGRFLLGPSCLALSPSELRCPAMCVSQSSGQHLLRGWALLPAAALSFPCLAPWTWSFNMPSELTLPHHPHPFSLIQTAEIRADIAARQQRSTDPSLGPQPSSGEPSVSRMYYSSLEPQGGVRAGGSGPPTSWWTQRSHEQVRLSRKSSFRPLECCCAGGAL